MRILCNLLLMLAEVRPGKLARQVENQKVRARLPVCRRLGWSFCPFVLEAAGAWGGKARHLTQLNTQKYALSCCGMGCLLVVMGCTKNSRGGKQA